MRKHLFIILVLSLVLVMNLRSAISVSVASPGDEPHQLSSLAFSVADPQQQPKEDSKVDPVILRALQALEAKDVTRETMDTMEVSSLSIKGVLQIDEGGNIQTYIVLAETGTARVEEL